MTPTEKLLRELIALPSVNPAFLRAGDPHAGEQRIAEFLLAVAAQAGLDVDFRAVSPGRPNLMARLRPSGQIRRRILLAPHLDTVGGEPLSPTLFDPVTKNGRLHGRGACDTKGSVAAMLSAVSALAKSAPRPRHTEIIFAGLVDEENNQAGSRALAASGFTADLAIVGEPTRLRVVTAHKGDLWLRLETHGRSAHGSRPELGRNAVHAMARAVEVLETRYAAHLRRRSHPLLGTATVSVGTISGGTQPNIVPAHCAISVDRRTLPGESEAAVHREIKSFLRERGVRVTLADSRGVPCPALETDPSLPLVQEFLRVVGQKQPAGVVFFCDAAVLAAGGIPSVVFGPGDIAQAHTADEWISLRELEQATALLTRFLESLP
ncbi:MAG: M20/M25/M40 family metallo-hydrolase [Verrucomicrobia bacterium]|nr:M20/M25/M40 family metallo-hydrolase [Verrucomicrobiota bacterium]